MSRTLRVIETTWMKPEVLLSLGRRAVPKLDARTHMIGVTGPQFDEGPSPFLILCNAFVHQDDLADLLGVSLGS